MKLLSICIPTYNRSKEVIYTVNTILTFIRKKNQDQEVEVIVSDNDSTDGTYEELKKIKGIILHRNKKNLQLGGNLFELIKISRGKYLWFFGDDDLLIENELEEICN